MMRVNLCGSGMHIRGISLITLTLFVSILLVLPEEAAAEGQLHGHARIEKIKGDPSKGYIELYEYKAFLSPNGNGTGHSYHIGDPGSAQHPYEGCITMPKSDDPVPLNPGTYSLMTSWGEIFPRGKIVSGINIVNAPPTTQQDALEPIDYSGYYDKTSWDPSGGNPVFQTFIATGTSITRAAFQKADGSNTGSVDFSIHRDNGTQVQNWPQVGPTRSVNRGGSGSDHWVSWNAGEVQTTPGQRYAIRLYGTSGVNLQPYWSNDGFYPQGTGYRTNQSNPAGQDYYIVVFSDNDDTIHTMSPRSSNIGDLAGWWDRWAQSYTANGGSLAGACLMGTLGGSSGWVFSVRVTVHVGSPGGPQVGPTKVMPVAFRPFIGVAGVCYSRGEVPTTPGQTYWIVYEREGGGGFNALRNSEGNTYPGGTSSYFNGTWNTQSYDLYIDVYEYAQTGPSPTPTPTNTPPPPGANLLVNPGAETGDFFGWTTGGSPAGQPIIDPSTHLSSQLNHSGSHRFGISVGWATANCYQYQEIAVNPGTEYTTALWAYNMDGTDEFAQFSWINGSFGGTENVLYTIGPSGAETTWHEYSGQTFVPTSSTVTIVVRYQHPAATSIASIHVDDMFVAALGVQDTPTPVPTNTPIPPATPTNTPPVETPTPPQTGIDGAGWRFY